MTTHGEKRLGMLTSSVASIIMRGGDAAWQSLRNQLWTATAEEFDSTTTGAREYGHEHEAEGVGKFFMRHPEVSGIEPGGFHVYAGEGPLAGWVGSSPDRKVILPESITGLEIKSPLSPADMASHTVLAHRDQCQHGLLVTGWSWWWLVVHHGEHYVEHKLFPDPSWQARYLSRAEKFLAYAYKGTPVKRRKFSIKDITGEKA